MSFKYFVAFFLLSISSFAQIQNNVSWQISSKPAAVKIGDEIELQIKATIKSGWHMYSSDLNPELGPIPTTVSFGKNPGFKIIGSLKPLHPIKKYDEIWAGDVTYFENQGNFVQKIKILAANPKISGKFNYQTCQDNGSCVMGNHEFSLNIKTEANLKNSDSSSVANLAAVSDISKNGDSLKHTDSIVSKTNIKSSKAVSPTNNKSQSLWSFLLIAFGAGLASIFMPCIYPIMPMTVSFFTKQKNGKSKALFYGISIMVIFGLMGLVTMAFGAPFLNFLSTHWIPNLVFFFIFILFGFSLLGAFEIVLPHETVNKIDRMGDSGGLIGIFFMALALVVVSFSCTVPFVGSLLIAASQGEVTRPIYGMLAFGFPFALVFSGLAMFPQMLKSLPKSGGWLNELKAVFGFLEFALALKFLSNIDLAYGWNLIHRNIFLTIWIVISVIIGLYILGFLRLSKDSPIQKRGGLRIAFSVVFFGLAAYMLPGVAGKSLNLLSGILPPMPIESHTSNNLAPAKNMRQLPHDLFGFADFDDAQAYAKKINKPILIDFTGYACANCRKMEETVWSKPEVLEKLKNDFVIASLYVDDKTELTKEKQYVSKLDGKQKITVGDKNIDLEISKYNTNAQPFYVIVNPDGEKLLPPVAFSSLEEFNTFLDSGKKAFQ